MRILLPLALLVVAACGDGSESAKRERAKEEIKEAAEEVREAVEAVGDVVEESAQDVSEAIEDTMEKAEDVGPHVGPLPPDPHQRKYRQPRPHRHQPSAQGRGGDA